MYGLVKPIISHAVMHTTPHHTDTPIYTHTYRWSDLTRYKTSLNITVFD